MSVMWGGSPTRVSPNRQDRLFSKEPRTVVARIQEIVDDVRRDKVSKLEQQLAAVKAENDKLRDLMPTYRAAFKPQRLAQRVAQMYGFRLSDLRGASRSRGVVIARHHAMWLVKQRFPYLSLPAIGRMFGGRDHTTVLHALREHPKRVARELTMPDPEEELDGQE
jgi:chromosomal replication initiator protein